MTWKMTTDLFDKQTKDRFFSQIDKIQAGECWNWIGALMKNGYGQFWLNSQNCYAHRISYEIFYGQFPSFALICHTCDNKRCVNPDHLYLGTHSQNLLDSYKRHPETKGRRWYTNRRKLS